MDIEQLKMILDAIQGISVDAKMILILYFLHGLLQTVLVMGGLIFVMVFCLRTFSSLYSPYLQIKRWRDQLGIGASGLLLDSELRRTVAKIEELIDDKLK